MYTVIKRIEIAGSHKLTLPYESKCSNLHGHNWIIKIVCQSEELTDYGMVVDFTKIKEMVGKLDHQNLNDVLLFNPTAENIAKYLCDNIPHCVKVSVQESEGNVAIYERD